MGARGRHREEGATRGPYPFGWPAWTAYALVLLAIAIVGATSPWIKQPSGTDQPLWPLMVDELTSVAMVFLLTPGIWWLAHHQRPGRVGWTQTAVAQSGGLMAFIAAHIAGLLLLRKAIYPLFGNSYTGEEDWLFGVILY